MTLMTLLIMLQDIQRRKLRCVEKCPNVQTCASVLMVSRSMKYDDTIQTIPGVVDCRNLGLTAVPKDIPFDTIEL